MKEKKLLDQVNLPKTERGRISFDALVKAAENQFYLKGYHQASVKDITEEAGIGLGTFYLYFESKIACYKYLLSNYSHYIRIRIAKRIKDTTSRKEAERLGLLEFLEIVSEKRHIYNIIWESLYIDKSLFIDYYTTFGEKYAANIKHYQKDNKYSDADPEVIAYMLMGISNFIGLRYVMFQEPEQEKLEQICTEIIEVLDRGLFNSDS